MLKRCYLLQKIAIVCPESFDRTNRSARTSQIGHKISETSLRTQTLAARSLSNGHRDGNSVILTLTGEKEEQYSTSSWWRVDFREFEGEGKGVGESRKPITPLLIILFKYRLKSPWCTEEIIARALEQIESKKTLGILGNCIGHQCTVKRRIAF